MARPALPRSEEIKLDALSSALENAAIGLKAGSLDMSSARELVQSSLAVALDVLSGAGMGTLFGALGAFATTLTPSPVLKALGIFGFGAVGLAADWMISDTGAANQVATSLTDALFNGAQALSDKINEIITDIANGINIITHQSMPHHDISYFELQSDGLFADVDGQAANGLELRVRVYLNGLNEGYLFTTNDEVVTPSHWQGTNGPGPKTPPTHEPPPAAWFLREEEGGELVAQTTLAVAELSPVESVLP